MNNFTGSVLFHVGFVDKMGTRLCFFGIKDILALPKGQIYAIFIPSVSHSAFVSISVRLLRVAVYFFAITRSMVHNPNTSIRRKKRSCRV
jgi:hypothetical protein